MRKKTKPPTYEETHAMLSKQFTLLHKRRYIMFKESDTNITDGTFQFVTLEDPRSFKKNDTITLAHCYYGIFFKGKISEIIYRLSVGKFVETTIICKLTSKSK